MGMGIRCGGCQFRARAGVGYCCDYVAITGTTRGAEPVRRCSHWKKEGPEGPVKLDGNKIRRLEGGRGLELYRQGLSDEKIGEAVGISAGTVRKWRIREGLAALYRGPGKITPPAHKPVQGEG